MDNVHLLIANSEQGLSSLIESLALDTCRDRAVVETTRIGEADELVKLGSSGGYQLIIVAADNLLPGPGSGDSWVSADEAVRAIHAIRCRCNTPVIALADFPADEVSLLEAGVQCVLRLPLNKEKVQLELRRALKLAEPFEGTKTSQKSSDETMSDGFGTALAQAIKNSGSVFR